MKKSALDAYDAITLELSKAEALTQHLIDRLEDVSHRAKAPELFALSLVAESVQRHHAQLAAKAKECLR